MREPKQFLLDNPELFLLYYFKDALRPDFDKPGKLEPFHLELIRTIQSENRALILEPAGHGKTTIVSTLLPIWRLCKWPNIRQAIIAKNEQDAKGIMRTIHSELLGNELLIRDFGEFQDKDDTAKAWAIERIDIKQKTRFTKEGSVMIYGSKGNVLGKRFDYVVCVPAGTQVQTKRGPRAIEQVTLSDQALTHCSRFRDVCRLGSRVAPGLVHLSVHTQPNEIAMTPEHPVLTPSGWLEAGKIKVGDEISAACQFGQEDVRPDLEEDFWWLAGWWLAEGGLESRYVRLTLGAHETETAEKLRAIGEKYGTSASTRLRSLSNAIEIFIYGKQMIDFFKEWDREGVCQKVIPGWVEKLPIEKIRQMLRGYVQGDGHKNGGGFGWRVTSVSLPLLQGVQRCLSRTNRWAPICKDAGEIRERSKQPSYLILIGVETTNWLGLTSHTIKRKNKGGKGWRSDGCRIWLTVKKTRTSDIPTKVYSLAVEEDRSFAVGPLMTHNCDDVVTEKNSATPEQRQGMLDWFNLGVETMPEHPTSQLHVVGTLFDPEDLYNTLRDLRYPESQEKIYTELRVDAVVDEERRITLWPERWTWDRLMGQKAKMGTLDFNKRYRNIAVDKSRIIFLHEYLYGGYIGKNKYPGCLDESFSMGDFLDNWRMIAGFDPALGVSKIAKFCAHIVIGVGSCVKHEKCYWVVDLERDQYTMPQQVDMLIEKHQRYDLWATVIEVNGYQVGLEQAMRLRMEENGLALNVMPHHTSRNNKPDPEIGVSGMQGMIENGMLHIPWADPHSRRVMQQLLDELEMYPAGKTTDTVMSLWFAWKTAQDASPRYSSYNRLEKPKESMFLKKGGRRVIQNPAYS